MLYLDDSHLNIKINEHLKLNIIQLHILLIINLTIKKRYADKHNIIGSQSWSWKHTTVRLGNRLMTV